METQDILRKFLKEFFQYRKDHCISQAEREKYKRYPGKVPYFANIDHKITEYSKLIQEVFGNIKIELNNSDYNAHFACIFEHHKNDYSYNDNFDNHFVKIKTTLNNKNIRTVILKHLYALDKLDLSASRNKNKNDRIKEDNAKKILASYYFRKRFIELYVDNNSEIRELLYDNEHIRLLLQNEKIFIETCVTHDQNYIHNYHPICKNVLSLNLGNLLKFIKIIGYEFELRAPENKHKYMITRSFELTNEGNDLIAKIESIINKKKIFNRNL